jgi:hypothetical protein
VGRHRARARERYVASVSRSAEQRALGFGEPLISIITGRK